MLAMKWALWDVFITEALEYLVNFFVCYAICISGCLHFISYRLERVSETIICAWLQWREILWKRDRHITLLLALNQTLPRPYRLSNGVELVKSELDALFSSVLRPNYSRNQACFLAAITSLNPCLFTRLHLQQISSLRPSPRLHPPIIHSAHQVYPSFLRGSSFIHTPSYQRQLTWHDSTV